MAQALYRRYRPDTFADLVGQDHVTDTLRAALDGGRTSHAYLFSGPRGCGKTTSARIMARCLNCAEGPTSTPCGTCESCIELASGGSGSLDVIEMDAASNRGIDDARDLRERAEFAPVRDRYKVIILDEAHMVTKEGANALLKLIEEPPAHVKFIFATTEPEKMLPTIRSRTHHYQFRLVPPQVLRPYLETICQQEGVQVEPGVLDLVIRAGGGSVRDSLSVLDQLLAGAEDGSLPYARCAALLGYTDANLLDEVIDALGAGNGAAVFTGIERVTSSGVDPKRFAEDLLQRLRDLVICALAADQASAILPHIADDQLSRMKQQAEQWGSRLLSRRADIVEEALANMVGATPPRLMLELLMGRLLVAGVAESTPAAQPTPPVAAAPQSRPNPVPAPVSQPAGTNTPPAATSQPRVTHPAPEPAPREPQPATPAANANFTAQWDRIIDEAKKLSAIAGAIIRDAKATVSGTTVYVSLAGPLASRLPANRAKIEQAITTVMGPGWTLSEGAPPADPKAPAPEAAPHPIEKSQPAPPHSAEPAPPPPEPTPVLEEPAPYDDAPPTPEAEEDLPSEYDRDIEAPPPPGVPQVLSILGGTIVEERIKEA